MSIEPVMASRREVVGAAGAAAAIAAAGLAGSMAGQARADEQASWDQEADVVVIGGGTGLYTALRARKAGLDVVLLERNGFVGGSTLFSSSVVWAPCNDVMAANGAEDSREEALEYIQAGAGDTYIPELAEAYVDNINTAVRNISDYAGVTWGYWVGGIDYRPELPGGKQIGRSLVPLADSTVDPTAGPSATAALVSALEPAVEEAGVDVLLNTRAKSLVTREAEDGTVEVLGVRAEGPDGAVSVKARKAVVMACGGFDANDEMMATYLRCPVKYSWGGAYSTGDGHKMAMRIGADMRFMNDAWMSPGYVVEREACKAAGSAMFSTAISDYGKPGLIYVNKHGKRFVNECSNYDSVGRSFVCLEEGIEPRGWQNLPAFAICDQACVDAYALNSGEAGAPGESFQSYETLDELAEACGIDADALKATVEEFNANAEQGLDPDFGRGQDYFGQHYQRIDTEKEGAFRTLAPLTQAPYWAAEIAPTILGTMGGVKVDEKAQAIDTDGNVIARLYAHGNCAGFGCGGAFYAGGGGTIGPSLALGEVAASQIEALEDWE